MTLELNRIYNMDCIEGLGKLVDESVDLTVTSPPYDDLRSYNGYSFDFESVSKELYRVTKDGGVVVWVVGDKTSKGSETGTSFKQALYFKEIGFNLYDTMIYLKQNPIPQNHRRYEQAFEYMFVFSKGRPKTFNALTTICKTSGKLYNYDSRSTATSLETKASVRKRTEVCQTKPTKLKTNVWTYAIGNNKSTCDKIAFGHPAIFPEKLAKDHILSWSNVGETILDPFMGSGTTAKMSLLNKRNFIGFEVSEEYVKIANERLQQITESEGTVV
ncbi:MULTISPECIES: DNA-methyltransferase [Bacillus cereus group]|uniref:DNA-methyltransferase n=1 Tax=Bacillus cereus group TaxID=86661 RepID=UPI001AEE6E52|nr:MULTISPECIES: site-specific DNA-methyltransferase [Bacillus cereus group]QTR81828.1 site-specific DNA-methyltransferase [Bacillus cytotoxicus]QTR85565.1 site-specific DNA-methyltransferase [Bacillus cytotoxicus]HDR4573110.1 site-specific DNA-methyltransferase [Bacillus cytotoxicus]HDR4589144.1 site-specific DNA-methyltransferase [Bacillus cytotoxicus]HDR7310299.1 site-specific DNA-methyltransferase [Bacillus cytotoxicus]